MVLEALIQGVIGFRTVPLVTEALKPKGLPKMHKSLYLASQDPIEYPSQERLSKDLSAYRAGA